MSSWATSTVGPSSSRRWGNHFAQSHSASRSGAVTITTSRSAGPSAVVASTSIVRASAVRSASRPVTATACSAYRSTSTTSTPPAWLASLPGPSTTPTGMTNAPGWPARRCHSVGRIAVASRTASITGSLGVVAGHSGGRLNGTVPSGSGGGQVPGIRWRSSVDDECPVGDGEDVVAPDGVRKKRRTGETHRCVRGRIRLDRHAPVGGHRDLERRFLHGGDAEFVGTQAPAGADPVAALRQPAGASRSRTGDLDQFHVVGGTLGRYCRIGGHDRADQEARRVERRRAVDRAVVDAGDPGNRLAAHRCDQVPEGAGRSVAHDGHVGVAVGSAHHEVHHFADYGSGRRR